MEEVKQSVLGSLGIDWKLFLAQLVNFGIVLFVLTKWVFKPLGIALEKRRKAIDKGLEDSKEAARAREEAETKAETTLGAARREAQRLIEEAETAAKKTMAETSEAAKAEVSRVVAEGRVRLTEEKERMVREAKTEIADLAVSAAAKAIGETLDDKTKRAMLDGAVKKILAE